MLKLITLLSFSLLAADLTTVAEKTKFEQTGRYAETIHLCKSFAVHFPRKVLCETFGVTPEGRPLHYLVASQDETLTPAVARIRKRPVVLIQGGIHAGEIDGKDAGFILLRNLLEGKRDKDLLKQVTVVFVPVFNVDGHERFGPNQRPNQNGPKETGWRTTSQNLNLNRDYLKADAPEMRAMIGLLNAWDPILYLDLHVTDGAQFRHEIAVMPAPNEPSNALTSSTKRLSARTLKDLTADGFHPVDFYPSFVKEDDPASGFAAHVAPPRFSQGYWALMPRIGVLIETHSWQPYETRVRATMSSVASLLRQAAESGVGWKAEADAAQKMDWRGKDVTLRWSAGERKREISFLGYEYTRKTSKVSSQYRVTYDTSKPEVWKLPLADEIVSEVTVKAPMSGYVIPRRFVPLVEEKLKAHQIKYTRVGRPVPLAAGEVFRATEMKFSPKSYEGRQMLQVSGKWGMGAFRIEAGALYVPLLQPKGLVVMHLLEPEAPDSLVSWGQFNAYFEQKEYLEDYLAESFAEELLGKDEKVRHEFQEFLKNEEHAKDPKKRLEFFYRRHPSWDLQYGMYPIFRVDKAL